MKEHNFTINIIWIFLFLQVVFLGFVKAQNSIDQVQDLEKVFLHLDKDYYLSGTELRYSAYVVDSKTQRLSDFSNILDVKLFDAKNSEIVSQKLLLKDGRSSGVLKLDKSLPTGDYFLIAFTNQTNVNNHRYSFKQKLTIVNPNEDISLKNQMENKMHFFPEGGRIIGGHLNTIAFQANFEEYDWNGVVVSNLGDTVAYIKPYKLNFGQFSFLAKENLIYKTKINLQNRVIEHQLPKIQTDNINSRIVNIESDTLSLIVNIGNDYSGNELGMLIYHNSEIILGAKQIIRGNRLIFRVPKSLLQDGLNSILLYNENQTILSERNFYMASKDKKGNDIKIVNTNLQKNKNVIIPLEVINGNLKTANTSISIKSLDFFDSMVGNNMDLYFNMFCALNILNPRDFINELQGDFQFTDIFLKTKSIGFKKISELDYLSQGKNFIDNNNKDYFTITGKVKNSDDDEPIRDSVIYCSVIGQVPQFFASKTDDKGRFYFQIRSFFGKSDIVLKVANIDESKKNLKYEIDKNDIDIQDYGFSNTVSFDIARLKEYINFHQQNQIIKRVYSPSKVQQDDLKSKFSTTGFFPNYSDSKELRQYEYIKDFKQLSRELLPGLTIKNSQSAENIYLREIDNSGRNSFIGRFEEEPLFLVDGLPIFDSDKIVGFSPAKINTISLINKKYFINGVFHDGILEIGTITSDYYKQNTSNHYWYSMQGFYKSSMDNKVENFNENFEKDKLPDFRDVLFWNSNFILMDSDNSKLVFSTSDDVGNYLLEMKGVDQNGNIIDYTEIIKVDK
jgi:hypothetical protein